MEPKLIAYAFSDLHINLWAKFNEDNQRTLNHFKVLFRLKELGIKNHVPILFCGDLVHKPETMDQELMGLIHNKFNELFTDTCPDFYCISGNHDMKLVNSIKNPTYSWLRVFDSMYKNFHCIDFSPVFLNKDTAVYGLPYIDHNIGVNEHLNSVYNESTKKGVKHQILLLHTDYPGAKDNDGREIGSVENLNINILNKFSLVLCGHIHKPQRLSKKVFMVGAPLQQRRTDMGSSLGYMEIYEDMSTKYIIWDDFPKFIDVENASDVKEDGNYYTVLPHKSSVKPLKQTKITKQLSKKSLARKYLRTKGVKDANKKELLIKILMKSDDTIS